MWFVWDPFGIFLFFLVWLLLLACDYILTRFVLYAWFPARDSDKNALIPLENPGYAFFCVYNVFVILAGVAHFRAMVTDPGSMDNIPVPPDCDKPRSCKLCNGNWKPPRAHHCKTCNRCIFRMDHHCPWINNCVGLKNQKYFIVFLAYIILLSVMCFLLLCLGGSFWIQQPYATMNRWTVVFCVFAFLVSAFFMFFAADFLIDQIESIESNTSLVETYQRSMGPVGTFGENMRQVFGRVSWRWVFPLSPRLRPDYGEQVAYLPDDQPAEYEDIGIAGEEDECELNADEDEDGNAAESGRSSKPFWTGNEVVSSSARLTRISAARRVEKRSSAEAQRDEDRGKADDRATHTLMVEQADDGKADDLTTKKTHQVQRELRLRAQRQLGQ
eukprot:GEMP01025397.1.p1 GENE.GEMP01025397.1~~GEMP01025397.1.p1  ORF type:complete len:412 (+),score=78.09 GEMP01025397.1:79-1236(+)